MDCDVVIFIFGLFILHFFFNLRGVGSGVKRIGSGEAAKSNMTDEKVLFEKYTQKLRLVRKVFPHKLYGYIHYRSQMACCEGENSNQAGGGHPTHSW